MSTPQPSVSTSRTPPRLTLRVGRRRWLALACGAALLPTGTGLVGCSVIDGISGDSGSGESSQRAQSTANSRNGNTTPARAIDDNTVATSVRNDSAWSWVITLQTGIRSDLGTGITNRRTGERVLIGPGQGGTSSVRRQPGWFVTERDRADQVFRVRLEQRVETWAEPRVFWFEVLGPLPAQLTISVPVRQDGAVLPRLLGASPSTPIASVPKSRYPSEDR